MCQPSLIFDCDSFPFEITDIKVDAEVTMICIKSKQIEQFCPLCNTVATKLHSYYYRSFKDLPNFERKVLLKLKCRKFYCTNGFCKKKIYVERFNHYFSRYSRATDRFYSKLLKIAMLAGGNVGARLSKTLNIPASSSTLIRQIHKQNIQQNNISEEIGIDDWAYKKGHNYGTAIIDLKTRKIIDLLPDREAKTVEHWLRQRPHVRIVTRDRFSRYAKGVSNGAPQAIQIADRWHLIKNMGEALTKLLERTRQSLKTRIVSTASKPKEDFESIDRSINRPISNSMSKRFVQMAQIKKYYAEKISIRTISKIVGVSKNTVKKYISLEEPPPKIPSRSNLTDYSEYVKSRLIQEPDLEIIKLWNEIREKGYKGCKSVFYDHLKGYRKGKRHPTTSESSMPYWSARKVSLLLYRKMKQLTIAERKFVSELKKKSKDIRLASSYVNRFRELFDSTNGEGLQDWIDDLSCTNLKELKGFAKGLLSDITAVKNAISLPWSNGQVEGQINKLKTIKRQMYGRAGFNLLRKRLVLEIF